MLDTAGTLRKSPLDALHARLGARMTAFAGWSLPVSFAGALAEHAHTRTKSSLFDVSHMGQIALSGPGAALALETLVPADIKGLAPGRQRYTFFLDEVGGIIDDLIVANHGDRLVLVVNGACAETDLAHLRINLPETTIEPESARALLALQGPAAAQTIARFAPTLAGLPFQGVTSCTLAGAACWVSRSGYTGEDGFEISVPADRAESLAEQFLAQPGVAPAGLAARDTLRLEAGLCLYGQDIDRLTSPIEAGLAWAIGKRRRQAMDFPGTRIIADHVRNGAPRQRIGLRLEGRALARAGTDIVAEDDTLAGTVTSGGFAPSLGGPIAMGYVRRDLAATEKLWLLVRGQRLAASVVPLPFVPHRYAV